ncbi:MAG: hypothetical protein ACPGVK_05455 [Halocynthiibacter sp.]
MTLGFEKFGLGSAAVAVLSACQMQTPEVSQTATSPVYHGIETRLLDGDLVRFILHMEGTKDRQDMLDYAECAASQYALIRGYGFARHVRTSVTEKAGQWSGDSVYTVSADLPKGIQTIDAETIVANCEETGIPTV